MEAWSTHHLYQDAEKSLGCEAALSLAQYAKSLISKDLPVIFTLRHLSKIVNVEYSLLRKTVERKREAANYRMFAIKKRSGGQRFIHAVIKPLFTTQQFINTAILQAVKPHSAAFAFHSKGGIRRCASLHCRARWLFKYDLENFFYNINEMDIYKIFYKLGYRPLLAFELARLCTTTLLPISLKKYTCPLPTYNPLGYSFYTNQTHAIGVLPQGAPTSPMLSNHAAFMLDIKMEDFAGKHNFVYTRYADDIVLSASTNLPKEMSIGQINRMVIKIIRECKFTENAKKTSVAGPGAKKIVLGLLVDSQEPRLSRETYKRIDRLLHATQKYGVKAVSEHEKFDSPYGFYNHLSGLISFVKDVDDKRWEEFSGRLSKI